MKKVLSRYKPAAVGILRVSDKTLYKFSSALSHISFILFKILAVLAKDVGLLLRRLRRRLKAKVLSWPPAEGFYLVAKRHHNRSIGRAHNHLLNRWDWYRRWHNWQWHPHVHYSAVAIFILAMLFWVGTFRNALASDLSYIWDFVTPGDYSTSSGAEVASSKGRLKVANYTSDANTAALYHLDESSGTSVTDSSSNSNTGTASSASWVAGNLNNAYSGDGSSKYISAPDSISLSITGANTLEAWTKFSSSFSANSHTTKQPVIDKGAYQLYYDNQTGKITYELQRPPDSNWTLQAGPAPSFGGTNGSWDANGKPSIESSLVVGTNLYVGTGPGTSDAGVYMWDGTIWSQIGGDGLNNSWATGTYEGVFALAANGSTTVYAGLGTTAGDAEVWRYDVSGGTWTKVAGDGIYSSWTGVYETVHSLAVSGTTVYAGLGDTAGDGDVWTCTSCSTSPSWSQVGGDGLNSGWAASTYEQVGVLKIVGTNLIAGLGTSAGDSEVWSWNGSAWTKLGGDGSGTAGQSWDNTIGMVVSLTSNGNNLYVGLGNVSTAGSADLWTCNLSTTCTPTAGWTQIGGDGLNSSWNTVYEKIRDMVFDGSGNLYAGLGDSSGDAEVWKWNGTTWSQIGGDSLNSSWPSTTLTDVRTLSIIGNTLYAGVSNASATTASAEEWQTDLTTISWTKIGGQYINKSWGFANLNSVKTLVTQDGKLFAGLGSGTTVQAGNAQVWQFDGSRWTLIGGQGVNSSWAANTFEDLLSMASYNDQIYIGLGTSTGDGEVWRWDGASWTRVGGGGINGGWAGGIYEDVNSMAVYNGNLYVGTGTSAGDGDVWKWNGTSWTQVGGDGLNSGWAAATYEYVPSMTVFNGQLAVGLAFNTGDAEVWAWNDSTWTKIGGDASGSGGQSWTTAGHSEVDSLAVYNGSLVAGLGAATGAAEAWQCSPGCTTTTGWTQIGGNGVNSSWPGGTYENASTLAVYDGELYAGLGNAATHGDIWKYNGSSWTQVAGQGVANWPNSVDSVWTLTVYRGKLMAGIGSTSNTDAQVWSYGNNAVLTSTATSQDTSWHHIAATYDGTTMKLYIDGVLNNSLAAGALSMPDGNQPLYIGANQGSTGDGRGQAFFAGSIDEIRISNTARSSFTTKPYSTAQETIRPNAALFPTGVASWDSFATSETLNGGSANYRLSSDGGTTWKYWSGSAWSTSNTLNDANIASVINSHIATFPVTSSGLLWQAILLGNGNQQVIINSVTVTATSDTTAPNNPTSASGLDSAGGSVSLTSGNWYNYTAPYFSWTPPSDPPSPSGGTSGVAGYYVYFGTDNTADPLTAGTFQTAANYTAGSLTSGNTYYLRIKTKDVAGNTNSTTVALFTYKFDSVAPAAVDYVNVSPVGCSTASTFSFSWPASSDTSSGIAGYEYKLGSTGSIQFNADLDVDAPPYQVGDNVFYVRAKDNAGNVSAFTTGIYCSTATATVVDGPTVVAGASSITVSWTSSKATTSFVKVQDGNTYISEQGQSSFSISHTVKVVGLEPEKSYQYQLAWTDSSGNPGQTPFFTTSTSTAPAVKNLESQILGPSATLLSWQTTELSSATIEYGIGNFSTTKTLSGTATSFTQQLTGLVPGSNYQVRIAARTLDGYPYFSVITFQTPPLPKISDVRFDYLPTAQASVRVSWQTNVPSTSLVRYTPSGGSTQTASSAELVTDHAITLESLQDNTNYQIVAVSTDQYGNTGTSDAQNYSTPFDTRPPKINNLNIEIKSSGVGSTQKAQIVVSWETDEPATSQVDYGPGISSDFYSSRTLEDRALSTTHVIIVSNLDPAKLYHLRAVSRDRSGNMGASIDTTAITGRIQRSVIDLIINALQRSLNFLTKLPLVGR